MKFLRRLRQLHTRTTATGRDRGSASVFFAVVVLAIFAVIGLVVDGGRAVQATQRADAIASEAARAAGQALDLGASRSGGAVAVDSQRAITAAEQYIAAAGATGTVKVESATTISVEVTLTVSTAFLRIVGKNAITVTGKATADLTDY